MRCFTPAFRASPLYNEPVCQRPSDRTPKINLGLHIWARRAPDGFHQLVTVYQTLEMHDVVTVTARRPSTATHSPNLERQPRSHDSRNTAWKMVALALEILGLTAEAEVDIHIEKRLPVQGGLGAGFKERGGGAGGAGSGAGNWEPASSESAQVSRPSFWSGAPSSRC
jgi:hypothetical protein